MRKYRYFDNLNKLFEDVSANRPVQQQTPQNQNNEPEKKSDSKEDKLDRLKNYEEYWNFEKNYHYNSQIDSAIKKINSNYSFRREEQVKLMKDVINQICGTAAKYIGLSWDMIGDDKYLFGFYETKGSKNHMQILIPYDFKFSNLKQKMLDWFLKKKETVNADMQNPNVKPKKPTIKIVESVAKDIDNISSENIKEDSLKYSEKIKNELKIKEILKNKKDNKKYFLPSKVDLSNEYNDFEWHDVTAYNVNDCLWVSSNEIGDDENDLGDLVISFIKLDDETNQILVCFQELMLLIDDFIELSNPFYLSLQEIYDVSIDLYTTIVEWSLENDTKSVNEDIANQTGKMSSDIMKDDSLKNGSPLVFKDNRIAEIMKDFCQYKFQRDFMTNLEAEQIDSLSLVHLGGSKRIKSFDELKYFKNLKTLPSEFFRDCEKLESVTLPEHLETISSKCFMNCKSIEKIEIPESVKTLGSECFKRCSKLKEIYIPSGITSIGSKINEECYTDFKFASKYQHPACLNSIISCLHNRQQRDLVDENGILVISGVALRYNGWGRKNLIFDEKISEIHPIMFESIKSDFEKIIIKNNVEFLETQRFGSISSVFNFPDCEKIEFDKCVFQGNDYTTRDGIIYTNDLKKVIYVPKYHNIKDIEFPKETEEFDRIAFRKVRKRKEVNYGVTKDIDEREMELTIPEGFKIVNGSFYESDIEKINFPSSLETVYLENTHLLEIDLSHCKNLKVLSKSAFQSNRKVKKIILPDHLTKIPDHCMSYCDSLEEIHLPEKIEELGSYCFSDCRKLTTINLPEKIKKMGSAPFDDCINLSCIHFETIDDLKERFKDTEIDDSRFVGNAFDSMTVNYCKTPENLIILDAEKFNVKNIKINNLIISEGTEKIVSGTFKGCEIKNIWLPSTLREVDSKSFSMSGESRVYIKDTKKLIDFKSDCFDTWRGVTFYVPEKRFHNYSQSNKYIKNLNLHRERNEVKMYKDDDSNLFGLGYGHEFKENQIGSLPYKIHWFTKNIEVKDKLKHFEGLLWFTQHSSNKKEYQKTLLDELEKYQYHPESIKINYKFTAIQNFDGVECLKEGLNIIDKNDLKSIIKHFKTQIKKFMMINSGGQYKFDKMEIEPIFNDKDEIDFDIEGHITGQKHYFHFLLKFLYNGIESKNFQDVDYMTDDEFLSRLKKDKEKEIQEMTNEVRNIINGIERPEKPENLLF